jgi:hypothetical protein
MKRITALLLVSLPVAFGAPPSTDTTPVDFSIGQVSYSAPRNYISQMSTWEGGPQIRVQFKVTVPGFEPLTRKTKRCLTAAAAKLPAGCAPIEFLVRSAGRGDHTDEQRFSDLTHLFNSQRPLAGPDGFELYEIGPASARINTYRKKTPEGTLLLVCHLPPSGDLRESDCANDTLLPNGNVLVYHLPGKQLELADQIDAGMRKLIESFLTPK